MRNLTLCIDAERFAELFFNVAKNKDEIWRQMTLIVFDAAKGVRAPASELQEFKGDALAFAIASIPKYSPRTRKAYWFFYKIVRRKMIGDAKRIRCATLGDNSDAIEISINDSAGVARESLFKEQRAKSWKSWSTHRLPTAAARESAKAYFRHILRRASAEYANETSVGAKAICAVAIKTTQNHARALCGEWLDVRCFKK